MSSKSKTNTHMSETNTQSAPTDSTVDANAPTVTINGVSKTLVKQTFSKLSKNPGVEFYAPEFDFNDPKDLEWAGAVWLSKAAARLARKAFGDIFVDNYDATTGKLNLKAWENDAQDWTSGAYTLSAIEEEISVINDKQLALTDDVNFGQTDASGALTPEAGAVNAQIAALTMKLSPLKQEKAKIQARYDAAVAKRDANEKAKAAPEQANS